MRPEVKEQFRNSEAFQWLRDNFEKYDSEFYCVSLMQGGLCHNDIKRLKLEIEDLGFLLKDSTGRYVGGRAYPFGSSSSNISDKQVRINFLKIIFNN